MKNFFEILLDYLFPKRCNSCGIIIKMDYAFGLCIECCQEVYFVKDNCCNKCGKEISRKIDYICDDCRRFQRHFDRAYSIVRYTKNMRKLLIDYKFYRKKEIETTLVNLLLCKADYLGDIELVLGVPSHAKKIYTRGFNQSEELALAFSKEINVEFSNKCITKVINTKSQSSLSKCDRLMNLEGAFKVTNREKIQGKKLLLIDDIYTTGSTVSECSKELKESGALAVYVLTVASGVGS